MGVSDLKKFIENINSFSDLPPTDQAFISQIQLKINEINTSAVAPKESDLLDFMKNIFRARREAVRNTEFDYLKSYSESTKCWIEFAKKVAQSAGGTYIDILMPGLPNRNGIEHFSGLPLTAFPDLTRLIMADDGTLYSTAHMFEAQRTGRGFYLLSSGTDVHRPWSLTEIYAYRHKSTHRVEYSGQTYQSFWHYLVSTSFLTPYSTIEFDATNTFLYDELVAKLGHLIDTFYSDNDKMDEFRRVLHDFSEELKGYPVEVVNKLYSQRVNTYDDRYSPLMELLWLGFNEKREGLIFVIEGIERHFSGQFKSPKLDRTLKIDTVLTILNFIEPVLVNDGGQKYTNKFFQAVYSAGDMLLAFNESVYPTIPEDEKEKLEHYPILKLHSTTSEHLCYCFKGLYEHSLKGEGRNIGVTYGYFVKLVLDFMPWYQFPEVFSTSGQVEHIKKMLRVKNLQNTDDLGEALKSPLLTSIERLNEHQVIPFVKQILDCSQTIEAFNSFTGAEKASVAERLGSLVEKACRSDLINERELTAIAQQWEEQTSIAISIFDEHVATQSM